MKRQAPQASRVSDIRDKNRISGEVPAGWPGVLFRIVGVGFAGAAVFHAAAIVHPGIAEPSPPWRHGLFVLINGLVAVGFFLRPVAFAWLLSVLTVQQLYSHGTYGWQVLTTEGRLDWASVLVLVAMPSLTALVWWEVGKKRVRERKRGT